MEMNEERKARLEKMVATTQLRLAMETDEVRKARLGKMVYEGEVAISHMLCREFIVYHNIAINITFHTPSEAFLQ